MPPVLRSAFGLTSPPPRQAIIAVVLWTLAPICVVFGGLTGLIGTVLAWGYGSYLLRKRQQWLAAHHPVSASVLP